MSGQDDISAGESTPDAQRTNLHVQLDAYRLRIRELEQLLREREATIVALQTEEDTLRLRLAAIQIELQQARARLEEQSPPPRWTFRGRRENP